MTTLELCEGFSVAGLSRWCRGKFNEYAETEAPLDVGDFLEARRVGVVKALEDESVARPLLVAAVKVDGELGERSSRRRQFDYARKRLGEAIANPPVKVTGNFAQGLFVFYDDFNNFRMSLVTGRVEGRKLVYNSFKRQTHYVSAERANRTFRDQLDKPLQSFKALREAFSTEALTKQFYTDLFGWYEWATSKAAGVQFPNDIRTDKDNRELLPEHMIRLITRLMFVWFIKHKGLVPDKIFDVKELKGILEDFDPNSMKSGNYYNAILQNLFFATLNNEIEQRRFATAVTTRDENEEHYGVKTLFRNPEGGSWFKVPDKEILRLFSTVPFLNGGLFECLDQPEDEKSKKILYFDGFSRAERVKGLLRRAFVPNRLFFDETRGLLSIFKRYNFTVEENSPNDEEVALDPELLGKVFENLLGAYNPETQETVRKTTGSFYTPREIANYMVDESLKQHLKTHADVDDSKLAELFEGEPGTSPFSWEKSQRLAKILRNVKVLDPACGSGAFPMGVLHRSVDLLSKLEGFSDNLYDLKLHLIENCIYGVDIQPIAVQISKLRFFISLVCEQEPDWSKKNFGIKSLPNLETKFVAANTLIGIGKKEDEQADFDLEDEEIAHLRKLLAEVRSKHFLSKSSVEKQKLRKQDRDLREKIEKRIIALASTPNLEKIRDLEGQIAKLEKEKEKVKGEKWVKEAQGLLLEGDEYAEPEKLVDVNKRRRDQIQRDIDRKIRENALEKGKKASKELIGEAEALANWDPYNQNKTSPFFDLQWMFGIRDGFDVVIGNPPYVRADEQSDWNQEQRRAILDSKQYETLWEKWDLFVAFIERGFKLLKPKGVTTMIVSDAYCHAKYAQKSQEWFLKNSKILRLDFCSGIQIFEASVHNLIYFFQKDEGATNIPKRINHSITFGNVRILQTEYQKLLTYRAFFPGEPENNKFKNPILTLDEICYVSVGMVIHADEKTAKGSFLTKELISKVKDKLHPKPFVEGKNLEKWVFPKHNYLEWGTKRAPGMFRRQTFPELYEHREKIMLPMVGDIRAAIDTQQFLCNHGIFVCVPWHQLSGVTNRSIKKYARYQYETPVRADLPDRNKLENISKRFNILFLLGVMNSRVARSFLSANRRNNIQLYPDDWKKLPIPDVPKEKQAPVVRLVEKILAIKKKDISADVSALERELDHLVYGLYGLSEEEIALVEDSSGEQPSAVKKPSAPKKPSGGGGRGRKTSVLVDDPGLD